MNKETKVIKIALADDHIVVRSALATLIDSFGDCKVIHQASNGKELMTQIKKSQLPDVVILDLNMPVMDGFETAKQLSKQHPKVHILMLTMYDSELALIRLLQSGVKGFLRKDTHPSELKFAIHSVMKYGYYYSNHTTGKLFNLFKSSDSTTITLQKAMLSDLEIEFLKLSSSDLTYRRISEIMELNPRTIDTMRDQMFNKLDVKSRVGLAMFAMRHGFVTL